MFSFNRTQPSATQASSSTPAPATQSGFWGGFGGSLKAVTSVFNQVAEKITTNTGSLLGSFNFTRRTQEPIKQTFAELLKTQTAGAAPTEPQAAEAPKEAASQEIKKEEPVIDPKTEALEQKIQDLVNTIAMKGKWTNMQLAKLANENTQEVVEVLQEILEETKSMLLITAGGEEEAQKEIVMESALVPLKAQDEEEMQVAQPQQEQEAAIQEPQAGSKRKASEEEETRAAPAPEKKRSRLTTQGLDLNNIVEGRTRSLRAIAKKILALETQAS